MKKTLTALLAALLMLLAPGVAHADLPGQPLGIDGPAASHQWRFALGDICVEDWTNGVLDDGLMDASVRWSASSDLNLHYRINCTDAGFTVAQTIRFINQVDNNDAPVARTHVWTQGGYLAENYVHTGVVVKLNLTTTGGVASNVTWLQYWENRRLVAAHEIGHALGLAHPFYEHPCETTGEVWWCRSDTVMALQGLVTSWDLHRVDIVYPW